MSPYEAIDQSHLRAMQWGFWALCGSFFFLCLTVGALAGTEWAYMLLDPPTFCVPAHPRM